MKGGCAPQMPGQVQGIRAHGLQPPSLGAQGAQHCLLSILRPRRSNWVEQAAFATGKQVMVWEQ